MQLWYLRLAAATVLPSCSLAFSSSAGASLVRHGHHRHSSFLAPSVISVRVPYFVGFTSLRGGGSDIGGRGDAIDVEASRRLPWSRNTGRAKKSRMRAVMGVEIVPVLGGAEAAAAAFAGHVPGVIVGVATIVWSTAIKTRVPPDSLLKPVAGAIGGLLTFLTIVLLGVRLFTAMPDSRSIDGFPTSIAHPEGCTRVDAEGGNKGIAAPIFGSSVDEVQAVVKSWFESQPRTKIETDRPGYLHAKCLTLLFGFPDSVGVKIFKNGSGKTEIWVQSELRVGQSDLGVNYNRVKEFLGYLGKELS
ncbi:unnamed protein product [Ascophyllum nodosum]